MKIKELLHVLKNVDPEARIEICLADHGEPLVITGVEVSMPASEAIKQPRIPSDRYIQPDGYPLVVLHVEGDLENELE